MSDTAALPNRAKKGVGLSGVTAGNTALCTVGRTGNDLHYRGYDILDVAETCEFEEIAHLLVHGALPTRAELAARDDDDPFVLQWGPKDLFVDLGAERLLAAAKGGKRSPSRSRASLALLSLPTWRGPWGSSSSTATSWRRTGASFSGTL